MLVHRPGYGYDLQRRFQDRLGFLGFSETVVYKALDKLRDEGLIEERGEKAIGGTRRGSPRVMYATTGEGVAAYRAWMESGASLELPRVQLQMRVAIAEPADLDPLLGVVEREIQTCLARLRDVARPSLAEVTSDALPWSKAAALLVGDAQALQLQAHVDWLETVQAVLIHRLGGAEPAG